MKDDILKKLFITLLSTAIEAAISKPKYFGIQLSCYYSAGSARIIQTLNYKLSACLYTQYYLFVESKQYCQFILEIGT